MPFFTGASSDSKRTWEKLLFRFPLGSVAAFRGISTVAVDVVALGVLGVIGIDLWRRSLSVLAETLETVFASLADILQEEDFEADDGVLVEIMQLPSSESASLLVLVRRFLLLMFLLSSTLSSSLLSLSILLLSCFLILFLSSSLSTLQLMTSLFSESLSLLLFLSLSSFFAERLE